MGQRGLLDPLRKRTHATLAAAWLDRAAVQLYQPPDSAIVRVL
jgi:hypothetical protein